MSPPPRDVQLRTLPLPSTCVVISSGHCAPCRRTRAHTSRSLQSTAGGLWIKSALLHKSDDALVVLRQPRPLVFFCRPPTCCLKRLLPTFVGAAVLRFPTRRPGPARTAFRHRKDRNCSASGVNAGPKSDSSLQLSNLRSPPTSGQMHEVFSRTGYRSATSKCRVQCDSVLSGGRLLTSPHSERSVAHPIHGLDRRSLDAAPATRPDPECGTRLASLRIE